jgi:5-methylcytosine-specific restriction endonuclease McrA
MLKMNTLVLNITWQIDRVVPWQEAMKLMFSGRAELVENRPGVSVRTPSRTYPVPSVIRINRGKVSHRSTRVRLTRKGVWDRDRGRCQYCAVRLPYDQMTFDHVVPKSNSGKTVWTNIVVSCEPCNQKKGDKSPAEAGMKLLKKPMVPKYDPHINSELDNEPEWIKYHVKSR